MVFPESKSKIFENTKNLRKIGKGLSTVVIKVGNNIRRVALYIHVRLTLGIIARIVAAIGAVVVHVCKLWWHLVKLVVSGRSEIEICYRIWYGLRMETINVVLISLDHAEQGIKGRPRV